MRIKTVKKMNLLELIRHIMANEELRGLYYVPTPLRGGVEISESGEVLVESVWADDTFTVEVEEKLTEDTEFKQTIALYQNCGIPRSFSMSGVSIREIKASLAIRAIEPLKIFIYTDELIEIWSKEHGIPESGVMEVSE